MSYTNEDQRHEARQFPANAEPPKRVARVVRSAAMDKNAHMAAELKKRVDAYLPHDYHAEIHVSAGGVCEVYVVGEDYAGWTMEDYVVPRLATGLVFLEVIQ